MSLKTKYCFLALALCGYFIQEASAAHPLVSEDPGALGKGSWQLESSMDYSRHADQGSAVREHMLNLTLSTGLSADLDAAISLPYLRDETPGLVRHYGSGDLGAFIKWRMFESEDGAMLAVKPALSLPSGSRVFGNGQPVYSLTVAGSQTVAATTWLVNGGLSHNADSTLLHRDIWNVSSALLYNLGAANTLVADLAAERNADVLGNDWLAYAVAGLIHHASASLDLDLGYRRSLRSANSLHSIGIGLSLRW